MLEENLPCWGCPYCRHAHRQWARFNDDVDDVVPLGVCNVTIHSADQSVPGNQVVSNWVESLSSLQLREAQINDPNIGVVIRWIEYPYEPTTRELQLSSPETRALWLTRDQLVFQDGVMFYSWTNIEGRSNCLIVPAELRDRVLYYCHNSKDSGHLGQSKTIDRLKEKFYWYGLYRDGSIYVKQCAVCNRNKNGIVHPVVLLKPTMQVILWNESISTFWDHLHAVSLAQFTSWSWWISLLNGLSLQLCRPKMQN